MLWFFFKLKFNTISRILSFMEENTKILSFFTYLKLHTKICVWMRWNMRTLADEWSIVLKIPCAANDEHFVAAQHKRPIQWLCVFSPSVTDLLTCSRNTTRAALSNCVWCVNISHCDFTIIIVIISAAGVCRSAGAETEIWSALEPDPGAETLRN